MKFLNSSTFFLLFMIVSLVLILFNLPDFVYMIIFSLAVVIIIARIRSYVQSKK